MTRRLGLGLACAAALGSLLPACGGAVQGSTGGSGGGSSSSSGTVTPSISGVLPNVAYLGRTLDLSISGDATSWSSATTVSFSDKQITVNKVTAASITGLLVNVSIADGATVGTDDVLVTDTGIVETYKGAFQVAEPINASSDEGTGVPQGGFADIHVNMLDLTTPFDPSGNSTTLTVTDTNLGLSEPSVGSSYALDFLVQADVLETVGEVGITVTSDGVDSPLPKAFAVAARTPTALTSGTAATGNIMVIDDTSLYQFAASDTSLRFVQLVLSSQTMGATEAAAIIPKSGKWADSTVGLVGGPYGYASTATDLFYLVVGDSANILQDPFGGAVPYDFSVTFTETKVTGVPWVDGNTSPATAITIATLPGLVQNANLLPGAATTPEDHWYEIAVVGSSAASPKTIHVATGGDPLTATVVDVFTSSEAMMMPLPAPMPADTSGDNGGQEDLVVPGITTDGNYFIHVYASMMMGSFSAMDATYDLFVEVK
jgi:hypothetical protein